MYIKACRSQETSDALGMKLRCLLHSVWMPGMEPRSSGRSASILTAQSFLNSMTFEAMSHVFSDNDLNDCFENKDMERARVREIVTISQRCGDIESVMFSKQSAGCSSQTDSVSG